MLVVLFDPVINPTTGVRVYAKHARVSCAELVQTMTNLGITHVRIGVLNDLGDVHAEFWFNHIQTF